MEDQALSAAWNALYGGRLRHAERLASQILASHPNDPSPNVLLGIVQVKLGDPHSALIPLQTARAFSPSLFEAANWLAFAFIRLNRFEEAEEAARDAIEIQPFNADAWNNLGSSLFGQARFEEAKKAFESSVQIDPKPASPYYNLGNSLQLLGRNEEAEKALRIALEKGASSASLYAKLAILSGKRNDHLEAVRFSKLALEMKPDLFEAEEQLGLSLFGLGQPEEGKIHFQEAIRLSTNPVETMAGFARVLQMSGAFEESAKISLTCLELEPGRAASYSALFNSGVVGEEMRPFVDKAEGLSGSDALSNENRVILHFGLGKAHNDLRDYHRAMGHYDKAHQILKDSDPMREFDQGEYARGIDEIIAACPPQLLRDPGSFGSTSDKPIFVLGMGRSGTTLTEQILASHPLVEGAGEVGFFIEGATVKMEAVKQFKPDSIKDLAKSYLDKLAAMHPKAARIVDKMPANYMVIGFIRIAFPNAKIIHLRRDPVNTCLSIWMTGMPPRWGNDKHHIVFAYRSYLRIMEYWRQHLPPSTMLEIQYEDLVQDSDSVIRRILDFCGLEWDDACLRHETGNRVVTTPSFWQVKQPIYRTSLDRAKKYENELGAFKELRSLAAKEAL